MSCNQYHLYSLIVPPSATANLSESMGTGASRYCLVLEVSNYTTMRLSLDLHKRSVWAKGAWHRSSHRLKLIWLKGRSLPRRRCLMMLPSAAWSLTLNLIGGWTTAVSIASLFFSSHLPKNLSPARIFSTTRYCTVSRGLATLRTSLDRLTDQP
jgi:hypothetical protein